MRLGLNSLIRDPEKPNRWIDVEGVLDLVLELGLDLIDVQLDRGFRSLNDVYLRSLREKCEALGIDVGYAGVGQGFVGVAEDANGKRVGVMLSDDEMTSRIQEVECGIEAALKVGAPLIRLFAGAVPSESPGAHRIWENAIEAFRHVAIFAENRGIQIGLHNHPPAVAPTSDDILRLLTEIDRPNVTVLMDTGQWWGSPGTNLKGISNPDLGFYRFMELVAPHAAYVRAKIYRIESGAEEWLDYPRIFRILESAEYLGPVSIVYENRNNRCGYKEALKLAVAHLRSCMHTS
ncbi:MAG: hypothetical protein CME21_15290 [Gemmatimonadetes bacterium]|jgi:sugar phosphate isomerase/epimerase|nr:hypothetical protein [Gemmatimonadota bacterium]